MNSLRVQVGLMVLLSYLLPVLLLGVFTGNILMRSLERKPKRPWLPARSMPLP